MSVEERMPSIHELQMHAMCGHDPVESELFRSVLSRIGDK